MSRRAARPGRAARSAGARPPAGSPGGERSESLKLLVVDPERERRAQLALAFDALSLEVRATDHPRVASALLTMEPPDLLVVALAEPDDAWMELVRRARAHQPHLPILALVPETMRAGDARRAGASVVLGVVAGAACHSDGLIRAMAELLAILVRGQMI